MCLYDLQKDFDTVEYFFLLERYKAGVNGKMWRILKDWYEGGSARVGVDGQLSKKYSIQRGVKQGSVSSPALFLHVDYGFSFEAAAIQITESNLK